MNTIRIKRTDKESVRSIRTSKAIKADSYLNSISSLEKSKRRHFYQRQGVLL